MTTTAESRFKVGQTRYTYNPQIDNTLHPVIRFTLCQSARDASADLLVINFYHLSNDFPWTFSLDDPPELVMESWTIEEACATQRELCERTGNWHFVPLDGVCWACSKQIYTIRSGRGHLTSCPHCGKSYCD